MGKAASGTRLRPVRERGDALRGQRSVFPAKVDLCGVLLYTLGVAAHEADAHPSGAEEHDMQNGQALLRRIEALPPERIAEIEDFVAFIAEREGARARISDAAAASAPAFAAIWDNPDDDAYNEL